MSRIVRLLVLAAAFTPHSAHAWQRTPPTSTARLGELVRVRTTDRAEHRGTLAFASRDSLVLTATDSTRRALLTQLITQIDARRVMPARQRALRGLVVGAAIGFLPAAIASLARGKHEQCVNVAPGSTCNVAYDNIDETAGLPAMLLGIIGAGVGTVVRWHHWQRVSLDVP